MASTIITKYGSGAPLASDLVRGELAVDTENGRLYTETSGGAVIEIGLNPTGNVDVTGTVTSDGLTVETASGGTATLSNSSTSTDSNTVIGTLVFQNNDDSANATNAEIRAKSDSTAGRTDVYIRGGSGGTLYDFLKVGFNGDISFYEDTGTTAKLFWNASAESLGIGTTSPAEELHIYKAATDPRIRISHGTNTVSGFNLGYSGQDVVITNTENGVMLFGTNNTERMRIDSSGTLLVNDTSARTYGAYGGSTSAGMQLAGTTVSSSAFSINRYGAVANGAQIVLAHSRGAAVGTNTIVANDDPLGIINFDGANGTDYDIAAQIRGEVDGTPGATTDMPGRLTFWTTANASATPSERMRIDSDGNLLVSHTSIGDYTTTAGSSFRASGFSTHTRDANPALLLNRLTSDGDIVIFRKDNVSVGSIGTLSSDLYIGTGDTGLTFNDGSDIIIPTDASTGIYRDAAIDLGYSSGRFKDLYRSGSTISTSDRNMKQDERALTEAETRVAQACKGLLKAFRFIDAVEVDGDNARIHFGIIAQDLQAAFEAEGLDATKYAMFRPSTYTDDEGNEQTRLGVCYENLLAFIIAAI